MYQQIGLYLVAVPLIEGVIHHSPTNSNQFESIEYYQQLPLTDLYEQRFVSHRFTYHLHIA